MSAATELADSMIVILTRASAIHGQALQRLAEIAGHGCEASSARSFEEGRLAVLDALGLAGAYPAVMTEPEPAVEAVDFEEAAAEADAATEPDEDTPTDL